MSGATNTLVIAQCTDEKRDGTHPAKELYMTSDLFRAQRRYAEAVADDWLILSAKYGLVRPDTEITSYDKTFDSGCTPTEPQQERKDEFFRLLAKKTLVNRIDEQTDDLEIGVTDWHVELICGQDYTNRVEWYLDQYDIPYSKPFDGERIGERIRSMTNTAREANNTSLHDYATH